MAPTPQPHAARGRLTTWPLGGQARADVREWLLGQWRQYASEEERASGLAGLRQQDELAGRRTQRAQGRW